MRVMCGPPYGVPIEKETHERYSDELKQAWETFNDWWHNVYPGSGKPISREDMPEEVKMAMQLILDTPIPGLEAQNITGKDSCYMVGVQSLLID